MVGSIITALYPHDPDSTQLYSFSPGIDPGIMINFSLVDEDTYAAEVISSVVAEGFDHLGTLLVALGENIRGTVEDEND